MYFDEHPGVIKKYKVRKSPVLIANDELVLAGTPKQGPRHNPTLTEEEALDVAAYLTAQPRPKFEKDEKPR